MPYIKILCFSLGKPSAPQTIRSNRSMRLHAYGWTDSFFPKRIADLGSRALIASKRNALGQESGPHRQRAVNGNEAQCARPEIWTTHTAIRREESQSRALMALNGHCRGTGVGKRPRSPSVHVVRDDHDGHENGRRHWHWHRH